MKHHKTLFSRFTIGLVNNRNFIAFIIGLGIVGGILLLLLTHAQSPYATGEAENGTLANGASSISDSLASGGQAVKFSSGTTSALSIRVSGNKFVNGQGTAIRLHGVNRSGTEYECTSSGGPFDGPSDAASIAAIATWHVNVVRIPLNEDCWLGINGFPVAYSSATYQQAITNYINLLNSNGIYAIVELHWTAPGTTKATGQQPMPDEDHASAFWSSVASTYKANPAVIFDLFNEPYPDNNQDTTAAWTCWKNGGNCSGVSYPVAGMQELVNTVRATGSINVVYVGGVQYSGQDDQWQTYKPADSAGQIAAGLHNYSTFGFCTTSTCWNANLTGVGTVPLVTDELGEGDCAAAYVTSYMNWADTNNVSYLGWAWDTYDCSGFPSLISNYNGTPTAFGAGFQQHFQQEFP